MKERDFQSQYNKWKLHNLPITCAEELKIVKGNRFAFSQLAEHQIRNLTTAKHGMFQFKIPDAGYQNPFDSFSLCKVPAFVVVLFYKPRQPKKFYMLDIDDVRASIDAGIKSLTEDECDQLASYKGILK